MGTRLQAAGQSPARNVFRSLAAVILALASASCDRGGPYRYVEAEALSPSFSGEKAFEHVKAVTELGARIPGSEPLEKSRVYIEKTLWASGWVTQRQTFTDSTPVGDIAFVNLRARFPANPRASSDPTLWTRRVSVLVASHYDTKKMPEDMNFAGANDPGSSIGALLEFARVVSATPALASELELIFFDGEEAYVSYTPSDGLYGSRHYGIGLRKWPENRKPEFGVLLDMVGDADLRIEIPSDSPKPLAAYLFQAAEELEHRSLFSWSRNAVIDDHQPLNDAGVPTIDVIDLQYDYWHTSGDTLDKLSPESLEIVGRVVTRMIEKYLVPEALKH